MMYPTADAIIAAADKLYEEIRDLSKRDATYALANALIEAQSAGVKAALDDLATRSSAAERGL